MPSVDEFVARRLPEWSAFEGLLRRAAGSGLRGFAGPELERFGQLYRRASSDLAVAQRDFPHDRVRAYLDQLLARAHPYVYQGRVSDWQGLLEFYRVGFPRLYRANGSYVLASLALFLLPALVAYIATLSSVTAQEALIPARLLGMVRQGQMWTDIPELVRPAESTFLMTHNLQVAIMAFAGGILLGLGTLYVLLQNGLMLGAVLGTCQAYGLGYPLVAFISAHGYLELSEIVIAGAAGLRLGTAILRPGLLARRESVVQGARVAAKLFVGSAPLLVGAGLLEAFVSPSDLPAPVKIGLGLATGIALYTYLLMAGRRADPRDNPRASPLADAER